MGKPTSKIDNFSNKTSSFLLSNHPQKPVFKFSRQEQYLRRRREHGKRQLSCRRTCGTVCEKRNPFGKCKLPNLKQTLNFSLCEGICMLCQNNKVKDLNVNTCSTFVATFL